MKYTHKYRGWKVEPSSDGKDHYITGPNCVLSIRIDTDDYEDATFPQIKQLLYVLGDNWKP